MAKHIVALRHGKPKSEGYAEDSLRPLSMEGREAQQRTTLKLKALGIVPTHILTSPLLRAVETAEIASDLFAVPLEEEPALGINFNAQALLEKIAAFEDGSTVFLVGHAPTLADFVHDLVGEQALPNGLSKSCAAVVRLSGKADWGKGEFLEYIEP